MLKSEVKPGVKSKKPYEEISAIFNGNEVKIRVPKSKFKPPKLTPSQAKLQEKCTCDEDENECDVTCGLYGDEGPGNKLNFQIPDDICESLTNRTCLNSEIVYAKEANPNVMCNVCNITPKGAPKGVNASKVPHPNKDVFVLQIGKQTDEPNRTGNIEVELITPRAPAKPKPPAHNCMQIQCEENDIPGMPCRHCIPGTPKRRKFRRKCCH